MELEREYLRKARRKNREIRGYFDDDEDEDTFSHAPTDTAPHGVSNHVATATKCPVEDEIDPLDAFMAGITAQVQQEQRVSNAPKRPIEKPSRFDEEDDSFMEAVAKSQKKARIASDAVFADSDEEVYATAKQLESDDEDDMNDQKKEIEALVPLNHTMMEYETFRKEFYTPHPAIAALSEAELEELRQELAVTIDGNDVPRPIRSFVEVGFDRKMLAMLMKLGLEAPTPIQAQAFPIAMSGRDMIGIAKTGSGKTLAFTLPMVVHIMDQRELRKDEGPIAIVLSPTRELAHQIFTQAKKFLSVYGAQCAAIYGGVGKWDQIQALRKGTEVVVATPGRLIDMIRKKNVKTKRVTFVVLDEADRMFEMGFEPQLRSIMGQIRPDRQTLMFSATFRKRVENLARDVLHDPVKITVGQIGQANEDIHQIAVVLGNHNAKWPWLMANLKRISGDGRVLIFAASKTGCEEMTKNLNALGYQCNCLHGDKNQQERNEALSKFRTGACPILVATDVASRGLDVKDVKTVINYDVAKNIDTHVHRIGRTGRMGTEGFEPGTAYTLVTNHDSQFAAQLVYNMDVSGQDVTTELLALAKRDPRFRRGTPANKSLSSASGSRLSARNGEEKPDVVDDEDEMEMKRWNESQRKTKADKRRGLGFGPGLSSPSGGMTFVKASSGDSRQQSIHMDFVKASNVAQPTSTGAPTPPPLPTMQPPPPPMQEAALTPAHSMLPPHVAQLQAALRNIGYGTRTATPSVVIGPLPPPIVSSTNVPPVPVNLPQSVREVTHSSSRDQDRSSRDRQRSRSRSHSSHSNRSRDRRYDRRSRSRNRGDSSRRRYSRSRSRDRYARDRRSRSRSRGRYRR